MKTNDTTISTQITAMKENLYALPNPTLFMEYIEEYLSLGSGAQMYYLTFDIDQFAAINDQYGYNIGDYIIYQNYTLIHQQFRELIESGYGIMSRLGGDEIAIFLKELSQDKVEQLIKDTLAHIQSFDYSRYGYPKTLTTTCGLYSTNTVNHIAELRHISTKAMMDGKRLGGNQFISLKN